MEYFEVIWYSLALISFICIMYVQKKSNWRDDEFGANVVVSLLLAPAVFLIFFPLAIYYLFENYTIEWED